MPDRRILKASDRAVPLLLDIIQSTKSLTEGSLASITLLSNSSESSDQVAVPNTAEFFIGFEDHLPFGFVGTIPLEDCGELKGPYLYRDYLHKGYGAFLLNYVVEQARSRKIRVLFLLIQSAAGLDVNFFRRNGFEIISDDVQYMRRWHDGLLAARSIPAGSILLARIPGIDE